MRRRPERDPMHPLSTGGPPDRLVVRAVTTRFAISVLVMFGVIVVLSLEGFSAFDFGRPSMSGHPARGDVAFAEGTVGRFQQLAPQTSNTCSLQPDTVVGYSDSTHIQGACCSAMDLATYRLQVDGLKQYASIPQIPRDPYDVPASLAKELLGYRKTIQLAPEKQKIYDDAMDMSAEKGPCCCKCWRWYAFEGLGKYLIAERGWNSAELAHLIGLVDGCGGSHNNAAGGTDRGH